MSPLRSIVRYAGSHRERFVSELREFVRIPSVSGDPKHASAVRRCALWLAAQLKTAGLERAQVVATPGHPVVYAEWLRAPGKPTVLIYGHYDVQPVEPLRDWRHPPFGGVVRDGFLHGRGASDDKGQLFTHLKALESCIRGVGRLPVNVKCLLEGEEEIGSPNLSAFLRRNRRALKADVAVMSDTPMLNADQPALAYSLRGQLAMELEVQGPSRDLHSGNFGGVVHDPLQAACEIVARFHHRNGRIAIPRFYDHVREATRAEQEYLAATGPSDEKILREVGVPEPWGETGYSLFERVTIRPSLSITGLRGGHGGPGPKGVIPKTAAVKLSFRLVPDQDPVQIEKIFRDFVAAITPPTVRVAVRTHIRSDPAQVDRRHPALRAGALAFERVFRRPSIWQRCGGSIAIVSDLRRLFGIPTLLMGFASPDDGLHSPNERFSLRNFHRGTLTNIVFLNELARLGRAVPECNGAPRKPCEVPP